ncbi:MAG: hypothetical protein QQW96_14990 [Tychonema bourrellyi B0820]|nr:hypothetical protein [Tychonema bourrellyi]MDQ2098942.1 hypothetical protein [Tychonema bourrellyi B0820]
MSQNLLISPNSKMGCRCWIKCCWIGLRFLRYKFYPWITLTIAPLKILAASGINRTHEKIRYMSAIGKINFAAVYELLNELLW